MLAMPSGIQECPPKSVMVRFYGAPPMALLTVGAGALLLARH